MYTQTHIDVGCEKNVQYHAKFKLLSENTPKSWKRHLDQIPLKVNGLLKRTASGCSWKTAPQHSSLLWFA